MKKKKKRIPEIWKSIDEMPVFNWFKIHETNDLSFMFKKEGTKRYNKKIKSVLLVSFMKLRDEYIDTFGISKELMQILLLEAEVQALRIKVLLTGDRFHNNFIRIKEMQIDSMRKDMGEGEDCSVTFARVEKYMGFALDDRRVSVKRYYNYINIIKQDAQNNKKRLQQT